MDTKNKDTNCLDLAIDQIIKTVDSSQFPNALPREPVWDVTVALHETGVDRAVAQVLETTWGRAARVTLDQQVEAMRAGECLWKSPSVTKSRWEIVDEIETAIIKTRAAAEIVGAAVGFAAGLRSGGASKMVTRSKLRAFLRNFDEAE